MNSRTFERSGWTVQADHNGKCGTEVSSLFGQTVWRWGRPGCGTELDDVEDGCELCLAEKVELRLGQGWGLSGERFTRLSRPRQ